MYLIVEHRWIEIKDMSNVMISALGLAIANHRMRLWLIGYLFTIYKKSHFPCSADITILTEKNMLSANSDDDSKEKNEVLDKDNDKDIESKLFLKTNK